MATAAVTVVTLLFLVGTLTVLRAVDAEEVGKPEDVNQNLNETTEMPEMSISTLLESIAALDKRVKVQEDFLGHIAAAAREVNLNSGTSVQARTSDSVVGLPAAFSSGTNSSVQLNSSLDFQQLLAKVTHLESIVDKGRRLNTFLGPDLKLTPQSGSCHSGSAVGNPLFITSPNFPGTYPKPATCTWVIEAPAGYAIHVNVTVKEINKCQGCSCDKLEINDMKPDNTTTLLGVYCGFRLADSFYSRSNRLQMTFRSESYGLYRDGFSVKLSL